MSLLPQHAEMRRTPDPDCDRHALQHAQRVQQATGAAQAARDSRPRRPT
jgi:hypothetical protein